MTRDRVPEHPGLKIKYLNRKLKEMTEVLDQEVEIDTTELDDLFASLDASLLKSKVAREAYAFLSSSKNFSNQPKV